MSLVAGTRLGPYEIQSAIGAGGMGEVYKARDTRLDRTVAIKILPAELSADPDRRTRFEREARAIAALNHPHICTLHDIGQQDGTTFLVMEHLVGLTLAERLEKGPLPLEQALTIATEISDALSAAHRQGVVHRDLKPGNVMLTKAGAKLLDFGLAKLTGHGEQPAATYAVSAVPTQAATLTGQGVVVGTLQYMAPEQLEGKPPDARTDLWALGAILYEMVTGKRAFDGASAVSVMSAILERDPAPISSLRPLTPLGLDRLVRRCLAKLPDERPDTAHDVGDDLRWLVGTNPLAESRGAGTLRRRAGWPAIVATSLLAATVVGASAIWLARVGSRETSLGGLSLQIYPADELGRRGLYLSTPGGARTAFAWSPNAQALVFVGRRGSTRQLYVRRLAMSEATPLPNTDGAESPAVSADGRWVAFWSRETIRKASLVGGGVMDVVTGVMFPPYGLVWDARGRLFFGRDDGRIWMVSADGVATPVTTLREGELYHRLPWPLPDGKTILFTVRKRQLSWGDEEVVALTLGTDERRLLLRDGTDARHVPTGHLAFMRRNVLFGVPFDLDRLRVRGAPLPVLDAVAQTLSAGATRNITGAGQFAFAPTGELAWLRGPVWGYPDAELVIVDRRGAITPLPAPPMSYTGRIRESPDGRCLAVSVATLTDIGLWIYDLERHTLSAIIRDGEADYPVWAPSGNVVFFHWVKDGRRRLASQRAEVSATPNVIAPGDLIPSSAAPGGGEIAAVRDQGELVRITVGRPQANLQPLIQGPAGGSPQYSPDGRWLAYSSNESGGRWEIYLRPSSGSGPVKQISFDGGYSPAWNPNGREIAFLSEADNRTQMMAVDFSSDPQPRIGRPHPLFVVDTGSVWVDCRVRCFDFAHDGEHFYAARPLKPSTDPIVTHINLIPNWFEELKAKVPAGGAK